MNTAPTTTTKPCGCVLHHTGDVITQRDRCPAHPAQTGHKLSEGFDPANYSIVDYLDNHQPTYVGGSVEYYIAEVKAWKEDMVRLLGENYPSKIGRCAHCGNGSVRYITVAEYLPTGENIVFGNDCTERLHFTGRDTLKIALIQKRAAARAESLRQHLAREKWLGEHPEVQPLIAQAGLPVHAKNGFVQDVLAKLDKWGSLSDKQIAAVQASLARDVAYAAKLEAEKAAGTDSKFVGVEGQKLAPTAVTCVRYGSYERDCFNPTRYGNNTETVHVCTFKDAAGNQIITKTPTFKAEVGQTGTLTGTVKVHSTYKDVRQTQVIRPKLVAR